MQKPSIGQVVLCDAEFLCGIEAIKVRAVFDTLTEDWGDYGELAVAQADEDVTGEYYIVGQSAEGDTFSFAAQEVKEWI